MESIYILQQLSDRLIRTASTKEGKYPCAESPLMHPRGRIGEQADTLIDAAKVGKCPLATSLHYDGRYIMYTQTDYDYFSIWHERLSYGCLTCKQVSHDHWRRLIVRHQKVCTIGMQTAVGSFLPAVVTMAFMPVSISLLSTKWKVTKALHMLPQRDPEDVLPPSALFL